MACYLIGSDKGDGTDDGMTEDETEELLDDSTDYAPGNRSGMEGSRRDSGVWEPRSSLEGVGSDAGFVTCTGPRTLSLSNLCFKIMKWAVAEFSWFYGVEQHVLRWKSRLLYADTLHTKEMQPVMSGNVLVSHVHNIIMSGNSRRFRVVKSKHSMPSDKKCVNIWIALGHKHDLDTYIDEEYLGKSIFFGRLHGTLWMPRLSLCHQA